ncbi:MAG: mechanosensitive ion channel [Verrucomicrobia bacterium]|nr:mechanosensitive ion channel [Verrucomicrobiota bacterium]
MFENSLWWIEALIGVTVLLGVQLGIKKVTNYLSSKANKELDWHIYLPQIILAPVSILLWIVGASYVVDIIGQQMGFTKALEYLAPLRKATVIATFAWMLFRWKNAVQKVFLRAKAQNVDSGTLQIVERLSTIGLVVLTALLILQAFGVNIAPLLAFGSIGAASLGFAGKDVIANFCSGLMLNITRPFVVGEEIMLPEKNLEGIIEEIGWFKTSIRDKEKRAVYLPNNFFSTMVLVNVSRMSHRRIKQSLHIDYADSAKIAECSEKIQSYLKKAPGIDAKMPIYVHCRSFGPYAFEIEIEAFSPQTKLKDFYPLEHQILLGVQKEMESIGITPATPRIKMESSDLFRS